MDTHEGEYHYKEIKMISAQHSSNSGTIVNGGMVMKPGKHQRSKQTCKDLCWKVLDPAQSFVLRSYTMHELRNQHIAIG